MIVIHKSSVRAKRSNRDPARKRSSFELLTTATLRKMEFGAIPHITWEVIYPRELLTSHHHGDAPVPQNDAVGMAEFFIIVSGTGIFTGGNESEQVTTGDLIYIKRGEVHSLANISNTENLVYICIGVTTGGGTFNVVD